MSTAKGPQNKTKQAAGCSRCCQERGKEGLEGKVSRCELRQGLSAQASNSPGNIPGFHEVRKLLHSEGNNHQAKRQPTEWVKATSTAHLTEAEVEDTGITTKTPNPEFSS